MSTIQDTFLTDSAIMIRLHEVANLPVRQARMIVRDFNLDIVADRRFAAEETLALRHGLVSTLGQMQQQHEDIVTLLSLLRLDRSSERDLKSLRRALNQHDDFEAFIAA